MFISILLSSFLFTIGMFLPRKHIIISLISLELVLLSMNMNFVTFSVYLVDFLNQLYVLLILTVAAAEPALGLAILVMYYRLSGGIYIDLMNLLKS